MRVRTYAALSLNRTLSISGWLDHHRDIEVGIILLNVDTHSFALFSFLGDPWKDMKNGIMRVFFISPTKPHSSWFCQLWTLSLSRLSDFVIKGRLPAIWKTDYPVQAPDSGISRTFISANNVHLRNPRMSGDSWTAKSRSKRRNESVEGQVLQTRTLSCHRGLFIFSDAELTGGEAAVPRA